VVTEVSTPIAMWMVLFAVLPIARARKFLRVRRRRSLGQCLACGYDVRASPDRCPECGVAVANSSSTPSTVAP
jgi:predicted Zn-ribbon and HTH transcriptional regulator